MLSDMTGKMGSACRSRRVVVQRRSIAIDVCGPSATICGLFRHVMYSTKTGGNSGIPRCCHIPMSTSTPASVFPEYVRETVDDGLIQARRKLSAALVRHCAASNFRVNASRLARGCSNCRSVFAGRERTS